MLEKERLLFETIYPIPEHCIWNGAGYSITSYNAWAANDYKYMFLGWLARSKLITGEQS